VRGRERARERVCERERERERECEREGERSRPIELYLHRRDVRL
jgi:hypothetical protein